MNRRQFLTTVAAAPAAASLLEGKDGPVALKVQPFPMTAVRLASGPFLQAQEANLRVLHRLPADRLVHNFKVQAGLPSSAEPLGGWEKPDCELRGHFTGHFLSACALGYSSTGDASLKDKSGAIVAELAKCQDSKDGYLSAFPREYWDRLKAEQKVWAPFYTIHKIMAGLLDVNQHCANPQALSVVEGMARWADSWTAPLGDEHMQRVLKNEFGGMAETLYNLHGVTGNPKYAEVARRFEKRSFLDPLAARQDRLKGLHANTHVPQVIAAARGYELTGQPRYRDIADYFWTEVTSARSYVTGGTSNGELWQVDPKKLAQELAMYESTTECCVAYNMMKLTRHLYTWTARPEYFDYYERTLYNHRLGAIDMETGATMYYLPLNAGTWKTFNTDYDSFWCCTGTGVEEFAKLNDSIYFRSNDELFVNLFIPSTLDWKEKGVRVEQTTKFPDEPKTRLAIRTGKPVEARIRVRIPSWTRGATVRVNGQPEKAAANAGTYTTIARTWRDGDTVDVDLPMSIRVETMPDDPKLGAVLYGPLVLAGELGKEGMGKIIGPEGPEKKPADYPTPALKGSVTPAGQTLKFRAGDAKLAPLNSIFGQRYNVYWRLT